MSGMNTNASHGQPSPVTPRQSPAPGDGSESGGTRILMVDDNEDTSIAMKRLLERLGYRVHVANSVQSAIGAADAGGKFDLLISDIGLPDGSGLDILRYLNRDRPVKAIAVSGFGSDEDVRQCRDAGFAEHLTKPVSFERLEKIVREMTVG